MAVMYCAMPMFMESPNVFNVNKPFYYALINRDGVVFFKGSQQTF